ncbi:OadG-related small transporter subunit [Erysipelothrix sp. HDW6A]|nr:OadG-related small transporter subunit [Erysipelothrix sp. HDW6A]
MMNLNMDLIMEALQIMVVGMGGIFAVLSIIYLASVLLLKVFPEGKE